MGMVKFCVPEDRIAEYRCAAQADGAITLSEFIRRACHERSARVLTSPETAA
jgi:hypothetical protein